MPDSLLNRRLLLKAGGAGITGKVLATVSAGAEDDDDNTTGEINSLTGFDDTPQPITNNSNRFQLITPANQLIIEAETDDIIDLVFEWDDSITVGFTGSSISGSGILIDESDVGEQRAIYRGSGSEFGNNVYERLTLRGLDTSDVSPGDEVNVEVSARQADSPDDAEDFEDVIDAVDDGTFEPDTTTGATFEVTQGTLISANNAATTNLDTGPNVDHTIAFDIGQLRDEGAGGTPAGPAKGIIVSYRIDDEDGFNFDLSDDDVTLGNAAADLDLEVVKSREIPGIGQVLLEIADGETLEDSANLDESDTVTVELSGLDTADINPDELDESDSRVDVGLHGPATFDPIVEDSITPDRGAYTIDTAEFEFGEQVAATEIEDWHDFDAVRDVLNGEYVLVNDLDSTTDGYGEVVADPDSGFEPIGDNENEFTGTFDGNEHEIRDLVIDRSGEDRVGLFGTTSNAEIKNIHIDTPEITGGSFTGSLAGSITGGTVEKASVTVGEGINGTQQSGGLIGSASGDATIKDSEATIESTVEVTDGPNVGGLAGDLQVEAEVINSHVHVGEEGDVIASEFNAAGLVGSVFNGGPTIQQSTVTIDGRLEAKGFGQVAGITGFNSGNVINSEASIAGDLVGDNEVAGLVGRNDAGTIEGSYAEGDVAGESEVGGLVGRNDDGTIEDSHATGSVNGSGGGVGGLVGFNDGTIRESYATGNTADTSIDGRVGGLVGGNDGTIEDSYATGSVTGEGDETGRVGGLVGKNDGIVTESYAIGSVEAIFEVGGLVGFNDGGTVEESYATGSVTADRGVGGFVGLIGQDLESADDDHILRDSYVLVDDELPDENKVIGQILHGDGDGDVIIEHGETTLADGDETFVEDIEQELIDKFAREQNEMQGEGAETEMDEFDFTNTWDTVEEGESFNPTATNDGYPILQAIDPRPQLEVQGIADDSDQATFSVEITTPDDGAEVTEDEALDVEVEVANTGEAEAQQTINLISPIRDDDALELDGGATETVTFEIPGDEISGDVEITVESEDDSDSVTVTAVDPCFIATAAYNTPAAEEIDVLRDFRDDVLRRNALGRLFIKTYYWGSPPIARWIRRTNTRRELVKQHFVEPLVSIVQTSSDTWKRE